MAGRDLFAQFVEASGGREAAAVKLERAYSLVCHILTGKRAISKDMAARVEEVSEGAYSKSDLLWGDEATDKAA